MVIRRTSLRYVQPFVLLVKVLHIVMSDKQNVPPPRQMTVGKGRAEAYNELRPTSDDTFRKTPGIHIELNQGKEVDGETNLKLPLAGGNEIVGREEHGPLNVAPEVWITQPLNDSVISVGDVVVAFKTRGFRPSVETPVEVLLPQNGDKPALLESGNALTILVDLPCTQLVTLSATVGGQRFSTSVLFSTIQDEATVRSKRVLLPADAVWGVILGGLPSRKNTKTARTSPSGFRHDYSIGEYVHDEETNKKHVPHGAELRLGPREEGRGASLEPEKSPSPLSLVFLGNLSLDGQRHIWLQQMNGLSRARFSMKYLSFHSTVDDRGSEGVDANGASPWKQNVAEKFKLLLASAGVPLIKVPQPTLKADWSTFGVFSEGDASSNMNGENPMVDQSALRRSDISPEEEVFKAMLESFDHAGGEPHLMNPPWAREVFRYIMDAVKIASPDVLVVANGKTVGDSVLTRAARCAMGDRGRIVMDFPNMEPAQSIVADVLVTPSHFVGRHTDIEALAKIAGAQVVVITPGVKSGTSPAKARNGGLTAVDGSSESSTCHHSCGNVMGEPHHAVGFIGRLSPEKGPGLFLAVAKVLAELVPSASFVVVGDGPLRPALEAMAGRLGISRRVHFAGWADGAELQRFLSGMSLLFNPSLAEETFSVVNIEAMAAGTPVAAFGMGGMLEYLKPGVNALVLDDPEPQAAAAEIATVLLDTQRLENLAQRGRTDVLNNFGEEIALERWTELYEALGNGLGSRTHRDAK